MKKTQFGLIELGRGVAAALVVFHHAGDVMAEPRFFGVEPFAGHLRNFNVGVDFFFVLSGFIITWVHWEDLGKRSRIGPYILKRFLRIFPPYWGVLFPLTALYLVVPTAGAPIQHDPLNIFLSIFLIPNTSPPVLGVAWTLVHEIFFYGIFAGIIAVGQKGLWIFLIWLLAIVVGSFFAPLQFPLSFILNPFNAEFIFGVGGALLLKYRDIPMPATLATTATVAFTLLMLFDLHIQDNPLVGRLAFGTPALLFVLGAVEMERRGLVTVSPVALYFGAASYAIYLVHPVALSFSINALSRALNHHMPLSIVVLIPAMFAIGAGLAYRRFVEPVLTAYMRDILQSIFPVQPGRPVARP